MVVVHTHIIIRDALTPDKLSKKAKLAIHEADKSDGIIFCDISLWEIIMLTSKKRIEIAASYLEFIALLRKTRNYILQPITPEIAEISTNLSFEINCDPADRIIAATSIFTNSALITADKNLCNSRLINTIW